MFQQENELWATQTVKSVFLKQEQHEREVWEELEDTESSCCLHITSLHTGLQTHSGHPDWLCDELKTDMMSLCWSWSRGDKNLHHITPLWTMRAETAAQTEQLLPSSLEELRWRAESEAVPLQNKRWEKTAQAVYFGLSWRSVNVNVRHFHLKGGQVKRRNFCWWS